MRYILVLFTLMIMTFTSTIDVNAQNGSQADYVEGVVAVKFKPGSASNKKSEAVNSVNGNTEKEYTIVPGLQKITTNLDVQKAIDILSKNPNVEYAEPDFIVSLVHSGTTFPNDPQFNTYLWGMDNSNDADINGPEAWNHYTGDPNFIVANIDTGVDINHEDLVGNIWFNPGETGGGKESNGIDDDNNGYIDDWRGWDFRNNDNNPADGHGHGTHTAGTTCAKGNNNTGVTGVVWNCKTMALKFLSDGGSGSSLDAVEAIQYAASFGVKVSNNSWGGGGYSESLYNAIANSGSVFVAAAGNSNSNTDSSPLYPSSYNLDNIIAVASITSSGAKSSFSSYGPTTVDLGAPGSSIRSTLPTNLDSDGYASWSGTSMATPHVAGGVALVWGQNPGLNPIQAKNCILDNVKPWSSMANITLTEGILDAHSAVVNCSGTPDVCGDGTCGSTEDCNTCAADCGACPFCGDGTCDSNENCDTCETDCGICDPCGNGVCEVGEDCNSCPSDCISGSGPSCGNGVCEAGDGENCNNCPSDCASKTKGNPKTHYCCGASNDGCGPSQCNSDPYSCTTSSAGSYCCGDATCEGAEDSQSCEIDCPVSSCGDNSCDFDEDSCSCAADCGSPPGSEISCTDGEDNDCDNAVDCNDSDCDIDPACQNACTPTHSKEKGPRCSDGIDNDCDELIDGADPDC